MTCVFSRARRAPAKSYAVESGSEEESESASGSGSGDEYSESD